MLFSAFGFQTQSISLGDHLKGSADCIDLIIGCAVGKRCCFIEEIRDPISLTSLTLPCSARLATGSARETVSRSTRIDLREIRRMGLMGADCSDSHTLNLKLTISPSCMM